MAFRRRQDGAWRLLVGAPAWEARAGAAPLAHTGPQGEAQTGRPPERSWAPRHAASHAGLPGQVSFSHQLLGRWALECRSEAPRPHSTWRFTHPFLSLILSLFHSSSHAVFTKISPPHRRSTRPGFPGLQRECSHSRASLQSAGHRSPPCRQRPSATHSGEMDPNLHLGVTHVLTDTPSSEV